MASKKTTKKPLDKKIQDSAAENEKQSAEAKTEITKPDGDPVCPFLHLLGNAKLTGPFRCNMQPIERIAEVQTASGTFSIPVSLFAVEWDGEIKEVSTRKEATLWLRDRRRDSRGDTVSLSKVALFVKRTRAVQTKLAKLKATAQSDETYDKVAIALSKVNDILSDFDDE